MRLTWKRGMALTLAAVLLAGVSLAWAGGSVPRAAAAEPPTRGEFMRQKLEFSKLVLEGLSVENYDLISKNARNLRKLSLAAEWEVPMIPNANEYITFTAEFQRLCDDLVANARDKNLDGATLSYLRLTMSCVNCHKYVRVSRK
ncbi:MAG: hypothetical protein U0794_11440 [Isosphaeraceae bacterium]